MVPVIDIPWSCIVILKDIRCLPWNEDFKEALEALAELRPKVQVEIMYNETDESNVFQIVENMRDQAQCV